MPSTINGIGTWYYGKSNSTQREGECHSCHRQTVLSSYDTRLYVVVFFIPVIPLGRKRIVDQCSICQRHYSIGADQYQKMSTESIEKGMQEFKADPSAESALGVHGRLVAFQKFEEAKQFREQALQFFGNDAEFMTEMAAQLDEMSRTDELIPLLDLILLTDPGNKMIRARQAVLLSQRGEIDRARPLLDYLEKPGAFVDSSPGPLIHLAEMFSKQGRHEDALKMLEHMVRELPNLGKEAAFRRMVLSIEKKAGRTASIIPSPKNSLVGLLNPFNEDVDPTRRKAVWIGVGVVAVLALLAGINYYVSQHRQLHIVNGFRRDLQVSIDGAPALRVPPGRVEMPIREGKHKAKVTGAVEEEFDFDTQAGYFERFFRKPAWVLVPGEAAVLEPMTIVYAENPEPSSPEPMLFGKRLYYVPHCDYPFVEPPHQIKVKKNQSVRKVALAIPTLTVEQAAGLILRTDPEASLRYLEQHVADDPANEQLNRAYIYVGYQLKQEKRVARFLREGLDKRPIAMAWHRSWSSMVESAGQIDEAVAYYDKAIQAEGETAALLYLRSRIDPDINRSLESIEAAKKLDPSFPWIWYVEGNAAINRGDFASAKECFKQATELGVPTGLMEDPIFLTRLGVGEGPQLVTEFQNAMRQEILNPDHIERLTATLIANGSPDSARQEFEKWASHPSVRQSIGTDYLSRVREHLMYRLGDLQGFENAVKQSRAGESGYDPYRSEYLMAVGRANEAELQAPGDFMGLGEMFGLEMALAFHMEGDAERSKAWGEQVAAAWATQSGHERKGAEFLRATEVPSFDEFAKIQIRTIDKALLSALIARRFPEKSEPFTQLARKLTLARDIGSLVVAKALDSR